MTLKSDAKFKEKLTCGFKYDMSTLVHILTQPLKSPKILLWWDILSKVYEIWAKKIERSFLSWHWIVRQNLINPILRFQNLHEELDELSLEHPKVWKIVHWWALFVQSIVSDRKFQRNYVSSHSRVLQNLKENWLVAPKMT